MAARHSSTCHERHLKVRYTYYEHQLQRPNPRTPVPWIELKGFWLHEAGFTIHTPVRVRVMDGCLVVTVQRTK